MTEFVRVNPPLRKAAGEGGRTVFTYGFHSLRHTYITTLDSIGVSRERRMRLAGHTSNVHDRYTHTDLSTLKTSLESFPSFLKEAEPATKSGASTKTKRS